MRMRPGSHTDLQVIFGMLKCRQVAEKLKEYVEQHREYFESVDLETYQAVRELLRSEKILRDARKDRKETRVNMCKALEDLYQNGVDTGMGQKIEQGVERAEEYTAACRGKNEREGRNNTCVN